MIGQTVSHYQILSKLGAGGMGVVYKALDTRLHRHVAIKFLPPDLTHDDSAKTRFEREARTASALQHHNICTIHEIDETTDGRVFICMDYYEGETLKDKLDQGALATDEALDIALQIAQGLSKAHEAGMVHRDIKPANILITSDGVVKILDFGLAKLAGSTKVTRTGTTVGTVAYMSPEQASGEDLDARSDIWSLGAVLYEMLTGTSPFEADQEPAVLYRIVNDDPKPLVEHSTGIAQELQGIIDRALAKHRDDRYKSADEFRDDLKKYQSGSLPVRRQRRRRKYLMPLIIIAAAVVLAVVVRMFSATPDAVGEENLLAVMYFENLRDREDPQRLGDVISHLLITDLSESERMRVVSPQRLYDILKDMDREGEKIIDRNTATEVADRAGARWMLLGTILQQSPALIVTSQIVEVKTGDIVASQRVDGDPGEAVFSMVDRLKTDVRSDLNLPVDPAEEVDYSVADITTHSPEALRYYIEGIDNLWHVRKARAEMSFKKAIEFDSTFSMAYFRLARVAQGAEKMAAITQAQKYADRATPTQRAYINAYAKYWRGEIQAAIEALERVAERYPDEKEALLDLGNWHFWDHRDMHTAIDYYQQVLELDPEYKIAINQLAYAYMYAGERQTAIVLGDRLVALDPEEGYVYDTRAELHGFGAGIAKATALLLKGVALDPELIPSLRTLGHLYVLQREYDSAEVYFQRLLTMDAPQARSEGRTGKALIPLHQGKMTEALRMIEHGVVGDEMEGYSKNAYLRKLMIGSMICSETGQAREAVEWAQRWAQAIGDDYWRERGRIGEYQYNRALARAGELSVVEKRLAEWERSIIDTTDLYVMSPYWSAKAWYHWQKDGPESAFRYFEKASVLNHMAPMFLYPMALTRLEVGDTREAVAILEKLFADYYTRYPADWSIWAVKAHYYLGVAYEGLGEHDKATEQFERFVDIWRDADPGIAELEDARRRLSRL